MLGDIGVRPRYDEVYFAVFGKILVDRNRVRLAGLLRVGVDGQIFVFDFNELYRSLRRVFVFRGHRRYRFSDVAHLPLSQKRFVFDRFAVRPGRIFARHNSHNAGQLLGLLRADLFYLRVSLGAEESFAVEHVGQHEIIAINNLPGNFFAGIDSANRFSDDCKFGHFQLLGGSNRSTRSNVQIVSEVSFVDGRSSVQTS